MSNGKISILLIVVIVLIDQISKIWIKTNFMLGDYIRVADWFYIFFLENPGMAFGIELFNKVFLTVFRIVALGGIGYFIYYCLKHKYPLGFVICLSLVFAGALGNIIDSVFYGVIFTHSYGQVATAFTGYGYAPWLQGNVVDMFYFPIINTTLPEWFPFWGGNHFIFFRPVFNVADVAISTGVITMLVFYSKYINEKDKIENEKKNIETT